MVEKCRPLLIHLCISFTALSRGLEIVCPQTSQLWYGIAGLMRYLQHVTSHVACSNPTFVLLFFFFSMDFSRKKPSTPRTNNPPIGEEIYSARLQI